MNSELENERNEKNEHGLSDGLSELVNEKLPYDELEASELLSSELFDELLSERLFDERKTDRLLLGHGHLESIINIRDSTENYLSALDDDELQDYLEGTKQEQTILENDLHKVKREIEIRTMQSKLNKEKQRDSIRQYFPTPVILALANSNQYYGVFDNGAQAVEWMDKQPLNMRLRFEILSLRTINKLRPSASDWYDCETDDEFN